MHTADDERERDTDYPERLDAVSVSLQGLYEALDGQEGLAEVLKRLADTTVRAVPDADVVTVSVVSDGELQTAVTTDPRVVSVEDQQLASGRGPYLDAAEQRRPHRTPIDEQTQQRWPGFAHAAEAAGVSAYLSAPVLLDSDDETGELLGVLNIYGDSPHAFDPFDEALLHLLTTAVSAAITGARRQARSRQLTEQLQQALDSRGEIEQAKGVLMAIHGIDADSAFQRLVHESQQTNTKLHTIARQLLATL